MSKKSSVFEKELIIQAMKDSFVKLNPKIMFRNPILFIVEMGFFVTAFMTIFPDALGGTVERWFALTVSLILLFTLLFANFAEALAEGRGKAQAETLRSTKTEVTANKIIEDGEIEEVPAEQLQKGDIVLVSKGETIPGDGKVIEGMASVDESAITGESEPVLKEAGGDFDSVTGGTKVVSDEIKVKITAESGESFLDQMISLVEGAERQKTPNEIALTTVLISLTFIFLVVVGALPFLSNYLDIQIPIPVLVSLLICLIPTTIGGLLSAIGIAGMDRVTRFNVLAMSGRAVETSGNIDTIIFDKTGTITYGNRKASEFVPVGENELEETAEWAAISSLHDDTPEGRSVIALMKKEELNYDESIAEDADVIEFQAKTRRSGLDLKDGRQVRKGAVGAIEEWVEEQGGEIPDDYKEKADEISSEGGTPLGIAVDDHIYGIIHLKDTIKEGLKERLDKLRKMGIKTVMCTGDNPLTAEAIANEAGIDEYIAESKPEEKIEYLENEQKKGKLVAMTGDGTNDAPALAQADVGLAMQTGTQAAKEAGNMVDLDSNPTKLIEVISIGKQLLMTRGALTTFSIANDVAKYFAIIPAMFSLAIPQMEILNIMNLGSPQSAILSALIFNALIILGLVPLALKGVHYEPMSSNKLLKRNLLIYGFGGVIVPFVGIKIIDIVVNLLIY